MLAENGHSNTECKRSEGDAALTSDHKHCSGNINTQNTEPEEIHNLPKHTGIVWSTKVILPKVGLIIMTARHSKIYYIRPLRRLCNHWGLSVCWFVC